MADTDSPPPESKLSDQNRPVAATGDSAPATLRALEEAERFDLPAPEYTEEDVALKFAEKHDGQLRYVPDWGCWYFYHGTRWQKDRTLKAQNLCRGLCRQQAALAGPKAGPRMVQSKFVLAVLSLARSDSRMATEVDQWDSDPWLLNTPGGIVDLRTGKMRASRPEDYCTKATAVKPGGECREWLALLNRVTNGDKPMQQYLQRWAGYALTGCTREHALAFVYGPGANGKTTFLFAIGEILGDYHCTAPVEMFIASAYERHPTEIAMLRGARLVTATETDEGRYWNESKIKALTGGDLVTARFVRQDFFTFAPQFKLIVAGNHKPGLRNVDEAIRRRLHFIPFCVTIPEAERDSKLKEKLEKEWPGILQWAIKGCLQWQQIGLDPPESIRLASAAYLESRDAMSAWLEEETEIESDATKWCPKKALHQSWLAWTKAAGESAGSRPEFYDKLERRGYQPVRKATGRGFQGLRLKARSAFD